MTDEPLMVPAVMWRGKLLPMTEAITRAKQSKALAGKPYARVVCPHCQKEGGANIMHRWHFENCKEKPADGQE